VIKITFWVLAIPISCEVTEKELSIVRSIKVMTGGRLSMALTWEMLNPSDRMMPMYRIARKNIDENNLIITPDIHF
jgi:hypothetical protein